MRCFERAADADPGCAMAHWGIAYAVGPNYNKDWPAFGDEELPPRWPRRTGRRARRDACADREPRRGRADRGDARSLSVDVPVEDCSIWNDDYAAAMRDVYARFRTISTWRRLFAEALIERTPWQLWDLKTQRPAAGRRHARGGGGAGARRSAADRAARASRAAAHLHPPDGDVAPPRAGAARRPTQLRELVPDAGHLRHMPTHIDLLCGDYTRVVSTTPAIVADRKYLAREGALNFYSLYRCHDFHFKLYGAMFLGQFEPALEAADERSRRSPTNCCGSRRRPWPTGLEGFMPMRLHVLVRFGRWQEIIAEPLPADPDLYCMTTAMLHYAKGIAHAALGDIAAAERQRALFDEAVARVPERATCSTTPASTCSRSPPRC